MKKMRSVLAVLMGLATTPAWADFAIGITVDMAPPELPVYDQPPMPEPGYIWTPGYWAYTPDGGYFWVPGTWVMPPAIGLLWTPAWWGWDDGHFIFHRGYWGPHVGFYGGIDYGFGYGGEGYRGGRWEGDHFAYNQTVNNFGGNHVTNVYNQTIVHNTTVINHISYNGGSGGVRAQPTQADRLAEHEQHREPTNIQTQHIQAAAAHPDLRAAENHGHPPIAAAARPAQFSGPGISAAHGAQPAPAQHPTEQHAAPQPQHPAPGAAPPPGTQPAHPQGAPVAPPQHEAPASRPEARPQPQHAAPPPQAPHPAPAPRPMPQHEAPAPHPQPMPQPPHPAAPPPQAHPQPQPHPEPQHPGKEERKEPPHRH